MSKVISSTAVSTSEVFTERCLRHKNEVIKFFCPKHEVLGCTDCMTMDHRTCKIDYIPDKCEGIGESDEYTDIMKKLEQKVKEADVVTKKGEGRDKEIDAQYESIMKGIAKFRKEIINDRLDQHEKKITEVANKQKSQAKQVVKNALDTCSNISSDIKKFQTLLQDSKSTNTNGQLYITIKQAKSKLESNEITLVDHALEKANVQYKFEQCKDLEELLCKQDGFGKLRFTTTVGTPSKAKHSKSLVYEDAINIKTESDKAFFKCNVLGCAALSTSKVVLSDGIHNKKLKVVETKTKTIVEEKVIDSPPSGIAALPNDHIAVIVSDRSEIMIMTTGHKISTVRKIKVTERCRDVCYCQNRLYVLCKNPNCIVIIDMQGTVLDKIPLQNQVSQDMFAYISCSKNADLLYVSDSESNSIVSLTLKGEITAVYQNTELCGPKGMPMLEDGSLLVCSFRNHSIHRISGDLKEGQKVQMM